MKTHVILYCVILVLTSQPTLHAQPNPAQEPVLDDSRVPRAKKTERKLPEQKPPEPPKPKEEPRYEWREFAVADLRDLQFDAWDGTISFTIGDETYVFQPRTDDKTAAPTDVTAGASVLAQLRVAQRVRIPVLIAAEPPKKHIISRWILKFPDEK